jgi:pyrroline-5-carboxylate reductase
MSASYRFIGAGNIVRAILKGILISGNFPEEDIGIYDIQESVRKHFSEQGYETYDSITALSKGAKVIAVAVTPQVVGSVIEELKSSFSEDTIILSVVAGMDTSWYTERLGLNAKVVRCMPTLTAQVGMGSFAVCRSDAVTGKDFESVKYFLSSAGIVETIPEKLMTEVVALNGSAPGYFYYMTRIVMDEAEKMGFDRKTAMRLFAGTMKGSAETMLSGGMSVEELEKILRLPGGTTVAALEEMEKMGFETCIREGLNACVARCKELGKL